MMQLDQFNNFIFLEQNPMEAFSDLYQSIFMDKVDNLKKNTGWSSCIVVEKFIFHNAHAITLIFNVAIYFSYAAPDNMHLNKPFIRLGSCNDFKVLQLNSLKHYRNSKLQYSYSLNLLKTLFNSSKLPTNLLNSHKLAETP